jgi:hypothetical protein
MKMQMSYDLALASRESGERIGMEIVPAPHTAIAENEKRQIA